MEKIFVSACLMGARVRYDGRAKTLEDQLLATWRAEGRLLTLCPEMAAGLPSPRPPAEIAPGATAEAVLKGRAGIFDRDGLDMTHEFTTGANLALELAQSHDCRFALLADGSPSCGSTFVYSGDFDGQRHEGQGVVAARLRAAGVAVYAPSQLRELALALEEAENTSA
ncbi:purine-nucleoside phosphorylase [Jannaschia sp. EhC01]|nr:purine-nucleoside phosphorylase [Jannaschia sp. EhC01]